MMNEIFKKELANYNLQEMYHKSKQKGYYDTEYHKKEERDANICWCATKRLMEKLLGSEITTEIAIEAMHMAEEAFKKGITCIE